MRTASCRFGKGGRGTISANVKATFNSANAFTLLRTGGGSVAYRASVDEAGVYAATQGATIDYMQNNLLNLLGLLGSSNADLPIWVKPTEEGFPPVGVYRDRISISWSWSICTGLGLIGLCALGSSDTGTGTSVIDITLTVTPRNATLSTSSTTTWDPVNKTFNPRTLPGSRRIVSTAFANPDIVPLDGGRSISSCRPRRGRCCRSTVMARRAARPSS